MSKKKAVDLDSILDSALDEFEEQQLEEKAAATEKSGNAKTNEGKKQESLKEKQERAAELQRLMKGVEDPEFGPTVQKTLQQLSNVDEGNETVEDLFVNLKDRFKDDRKPGFLPGEYKICDLNEAISLGGWVI